MEERQIIEGEQDSETGFRIFGDHERRGFYVNGLEETVVFGLREDPVEDFFDL
jgi:hypothetical protein